MAEGRVALIAGGGALPAEAAACLAERVSLAAVVGFEGISDPHLVPASDRLRLGQVEALMARLRALEVDRLLIVGSFDPELVTRASSSSVPEPLDATSPSLDPAPLDATSPRLDRAPLDAASLRFDPDPTARRLLASRAAASPVAWMRSIADWLGQQGLVLLRQDEALAPMIAPCGALASTRPNAGHARDLVAGRAALRALAPDDAAQAVAVRDGRVVATEALDGTDALIRRVRALAGPGATIVKGARPGQDRRLDLPAVGPDTVAALRAADCSALAIEAGATLVIDAKALRDAADEGGLVVWGFDATSEGGA